MKTRMQMLCGVGVAVAASGITWWVESRRCRTQLRVVEQWLDYHRCEDELTGLMGRRGLEYIGQMMIDLARRDGSAVGLCVIRPRVESESHLLTVAEAAQDVFRASDLIARYSGQEIVVMGKGDGFAEDVVERITASVARYAPPGDRVDFELGVGVLAPWDGGGVEDLVEVAHSDRRRRASLKLE